MKQVAATLAFCIRDNQILLAMKKRGFGAGRWNGAGGKVEAGETMAEAMQRECREEIGVTPTVFEVVAHHSFILDADSDTPWQQIVTTYLVTAWEGDPHESDEMAPRWFSLTDIPYKRMWSDDIEWLPLVLERKLLRTVFKFDARQQVISSEVREVPSL